MPQPKLSLNDMPLEIINNISSRLSSEDFSRFRMTDNRICNATYGQDIAREDLATKAKVMSCDQLLSEIEDTKKSDHYLKEAMLSVLQEEMNGRIAEVKKVTDKIHFKYHYNYVDNCSLVSSGSLHSLSKNDDIEGAILLAMSMYSISESNMYSISKDSLICWTDDLQREDLPKYSEKEEALEEKFPKYGAIALEIITNKFIQAVKEGNLEEGNELESQLKKLSADKGKSEGFSR